VSNLVTDDVTCAPLLKWPGGKRRLLNSILPLVPRSFNRYFEPFLGGGALFFALAPKCAYLSDKNGELINTYAQVRDNPEAVIRKLCRLKNNEETYYTVRSSRPSSDVGRAARLIYLTTLAFNGIYRENLRGVFNVPYGFKTHLNPCDEHRIRETSRVLQHAYTREADFHTALKGARLGDLVYLDPPYTVAHGSNGFLKYNSKIFSWDDQLRLANLAKKLADKGCTVIVSNASHASIRNLYGGFSEKLIERNSVIAASSNYRAQVTESVYFAG